MNFTETYNTKGKLLMVRKKRSQMQKKREKISILLDEMVNLYFHNLCPDYTNKKEPPLK